MSLYSLFVERLRERLFDFRQLNFLNLSFNKCVLTLLKLMFTRRCLVEQEPDYTQVLLVLQLYFSASVHLSFASDDLAFACDVDSGLRGLAVAAFGTLLAREWPSSDALCVFTRLLLGLPSRIRRMCWRHLCLVLLWNLCGLTLAYVPQLP